LLPAEVDIFHSQTHAFEQAEPDPYSKEAINRDVPVSFERTRATSSHVITTGSTAGRVARTKLPSQSNLVCSTSEYENNNAASA
jgi:hypothetical protein